MRLALYEPDIPPNTGTLIRLCACFGVPLDIIEPCGFPFSDRTLQRAGMDYLPKADIAFHRSFAHFRETLGARRLVLLTTQAPLRHLDFVFAEKDVLLLGRESAGVPGSVHDTAGARIRIPMQPGLRSLNVAIAGAIALGEALRQTGRFPAA